MGLFFRSRRRRSGGGGLIGLLLIGGALYYTGALPVVWDHVKNAGELCSSAMGSVGVNGQSVCGPLSNFMAAADEKVQSMGEGVGGMFSDAGDQFNDTFSSTSMSLEGLTQQLDGVVNSFKGGSNFGSSQSSLEELMKMGPNGLGIPSGDMGQLKGAMDAFAIGKQLMGSQPELGTQWMQKGASMGEFGLMPQLSLGNAFAQGGNPQAALNYFTQANGSLNALRGNDSAAAQQLLGSLPVSPDKLQAQIIAAIKQMQIGK